MCVCVCVTEQQATGVSDVSRSRPTLELSDDEFQLSDAMYFCRRGMEVV